MCHDHTTNEPTNETPYGYCHCGCGQLAPIAQCTHTKYGHIKGQPTLFINGHHQAKFHKVVAANPSGLCLCGCGNPTPIATYSRYKDGIVMGQPVRYLPGHQKHKPIEDRFWGKVDRRGLDECWKWLGAKAPHGYGQIGTKSSKHMLAHRFSYELHYGPIPDNDTYHGTCVLHKCDNPSCVNPAHLFLGTQSDNVADMIAKGRDNYGRRTPSR